MRWSWSPEAQARPTPWGVKPIPKLNLEVWSGFKNRFSTAPHPYAGEMAQFSRARSAPLFFDFYSSSASITANCLFVVAHSHHHTAPPTHHGSQPTAPTYDDTCKQKESHKKRMIGSVDERWRRALALSERALVASSQQ